MHFCGLKKNRFNIKLGLNKKKTSMREDQINSYLKSNNEFEFSGNA